MSAYYGLDGQKISAKQYARIGVDHRRIAETTLPDGTWVSTVWVGIDMSWLDGPPLIFETMVFKDGTGFEALDEEKYATKEDALAGHDRMVAKWTAQVNGGTS